MNDRIGHGGRINSGWQPQGDRGSNPGPKVGYEKPKRENRREVEQGDIWGDKGRSIEEHVNNGGSPYAFNDRQVMTEVSMRSRL